MNPVSAQIRRPLLYLIGWAPTTVLLAYLLSFTHQMTMAQALILAIPLCIFYWFVCRSAQYSCRALSPERVGLEKLGLMHAGAAAIAACVWVFSAMVLAWILSSSVNALRGLSERL